jgi:hypothetical protein
MIGAEAAEIFYGGDRFTRVGAMPITVLKLLQDVGSVQLLDVAAPRHRKGMFLFLTKPEAVAELVKRVEMEWQIKIASDGAARSCCSMSSAKFFAVLCAPEGGYRSTKRTLAGAQGSSVK